MEPKEEIRAKLNIEDVIGQYVELRRAGRNFKGLSPFSSEKTPSFVVSPDKHIWHDFSSNRGGDVFSFVMEVEGIDFRAAMEMLARKAGVDISQYQTKGDKGLSQKKERLYKLLELAVRFYQQNLIGSIHAQEYVFKKRGLSKQVVQQFQIGYAPNGDDALLRALLKRGYNTDDVKDAGLLAIRRGRPGDMFRGRMMVPLCDGQGRVVGFTARLIDDQPNAPKYINTPQTLLYDKGRQVFGLHLAKEAIRRVGYAVVVEGNLDVVSSHQAGVAQVVATAGTAMTDFHLRSLSRLSGNVRLAFDGDAAGLAATERAIGIASKLGITLGIISLPEGFKDPDEVIQHDPKLWQQALEQPRDAVEWLLDEYARRFDLATAEGKRKATSKALEVIAAIQDPVEQEHYQQLVAARAGTSITALRKKISLTPISSAPVKKPISSVPSSAATDHYLYQDHLLGLALVYPDMRDSLRGLDEAVFEGGMRRTLFVLIQKLGAKAVTSELLDKLQSDALRVKINELSLIVEQKYVPTDDTLYYVASELAKRALLDSKTKQKDMLVRELGTIDDAVRRADVNGRIKTLLRDINTLKK